MSLLRTDRRRLADDFAPAASVYRPILQCLAALVGSAAVFYWVPALDLTVANWFYTHDQGFLMGHTPVIRIIRSLGIWITIGTAIGLAVVAVWWQVRPEAIARWPSETPRSDWWFICIGLLLGPGLLVNLVFKPLWGRPRPVHIEQFGGHDHFAPAWGLSRQCAWNCSFVSGEAAASAFILAFCFIVPPRWRVPMLVVAVAMTLADSFARMAAGGHFLSDVITAWLLIGLMILILRAQIYHGVLLGPLQRWWRVH